MKNVGNSKCKLLSILFVIFLGTFINNVPKASAETLYYYDKYTVVKEYTKPTTETWVPTWTPFDYYVLEAGYVHLREYIFVKSTGKYAAYGEGWHPYMDGCPRGYTYTTNTSGTGDTGNGVYRTQFTGEAYWSNAEGACRTTGTVDMLYNPKNPTSTSKRGSLVESNIIGGISSYPSDGESSDGFWYVRKGIYNQDPTMPGVFTSPTGTNIVSKDSYTISWGKSTDPDGDSVYYNIEYKYDNGSWTYLGRVESPTRSNWKPSDTNKIVRFRVQAVDSKGAQSGYRESNAYNINNNTAPNPPGNFTTPTTSLTAGSKADINWGISTDPDGVSRYNYNKYEVTYEPTFIKYPTFNQNPGWDPVCAYYDYSYDPKTKKYTMKDGVGYYQATEIPDGSILYGYLSAGGDSYKTSCPANASLYIYDYLPKRIIISSETSQFIQETYKSDGEPSVVKGKLTQANIVANDGAYPTNGVHTDGFYYERGTLQSGVSISYYLDYETNGSGNWKTVVSNSINNQFKNYLVDNDETIKTIRFRVRAKDQMDEYSGYTYSNTISLNHAPTLNGFTIPDQLVTLNETFFQFINGRATVTDVNVGEKLSFVYKIYNNKGDVLLNETIGVGTLTATGLSQPLLEGWKTARLSEDILNHLGTNHNAVLEVYVQDDKGLTSSKLTQTFDIDVTPPTINIGNTKDKIVVTEDFKLNFNISAVDTGPVKVDDVNVSYKLFEGEPEMGKILTGPSHSMFAVNNISNGTIFFDSTILIPYSDVKQFTDGKIYTLEIRSSDGRNPDSVKRVKIKIDSTGLSDPSKL